MSCGRLRREFVIAMIISCALAVPCQGQKPKHKSEQPAKPDPVVQPVSAPAPLPREQMPVSPPQVAFSDGQLSILAEDSTLGDILRGVRQQTGALVDIPGNATERVFGRFGPGPARDVLAALLNGSHFNYVLLWSPINPNVLNRVILSSISSEAGPAREANASAPPEPTHPRAPAPVDDGAELPDDPTADH